MSWYGPGERVTYYTQRNNPPPETAALQCNVTAIVTMLDGSGITLPDTRGEQPEVALARFASTDARVLAYMREYQPDAVKWGWLPYTESHTLARAANLWLGADAETGPVVYRQDQPLEAVVADLAGGRCSVVLGRFTPGGHFVTVIAVECTQWLHGNPETKDVSMSGVQHFMVHDPWGDWHTGYRDHNGARCIYTPAELMALVLTEGRNAKWAHSIRRAA